MTLTGGSGGYDIKMIAPFPTEEYNDVPTILVAATFANTLELRFKLNGDPSMTEIGIMHEVYVSTLSEEPSHSVKSA